MSWKMIGADCLDAMAEMPECSVDSIVTDPPYGINFMGKEWDGPGGMLGQIATGKEKRGAFAYGGSHSRGYADNDNAKFQEWCLLWATEALRVLKPGGHLLAFGGTRTYHRLACGVEDAGFEVRDSLAFLWCYGTGFPKSHNLKGDREGWGTALKPAHEPIVMGRKPLAGTVAANVQEYGTGALNIDGGRVGTESNAPGSTPPSSVNGRRGSMAGPMDRVSYNPNQGRWPANVILDPEAGAMLDEQSGETVSTGGRIGKKETSGVNIAPAGQYQAGDPGYGDTGGASRFFYCAKASRAERNAGLDGLPRKKGGIKNDSGRGFSERDPYAEILVANNHPTVKPLDLMRYLVRLVTPPGGTVLDPFTGSGTTGIAAGLEGFDFIGIEREAEYREIAEARLKWWADREGETAEILRRAGLAEKEREQAEAVGQGSLFDEAA